MTTGVDRATTRRAIPDGESGRRGTGLGRWIAGASISPSRRDGADSLRFKADLATIPSGPPHGPDTGVSVWVGISGPRHRGGATGPRPKPIRHKSLID